MRTFITMLIVIFTLSLMTGCSSYYWNRAQFEMKGNPFLGGKEILAESTAERDSLRAEARISTLGGQEGFSINTRGTNEVYWRDGEKEFHYRNVPDYYGYYRPYGYYGYGGNYHYDLYPSPGGKYYAPRRCY